MLEEFKSIKDNLLKSVFSAVASVSETTQDGSKGPTGTLRDIIGSLAGIAGKGKDEIVQIISREIGIAVAGVVKEPLTRILESKKIKITVELANRDDEKKDDSPPKKKKPTPK